MQQIKQILRITHLIKIKKGAFHKEPFLSFQ